MIPGILSHRVKWLKLDAGKSSQFTADVKNVWSYASIGPLSSRRDVSLSTSMTLFSTCKVPAVIKSHQEINPTVDFGNQLSI
jgi:hypothetical protein